LGKIDGAGNSSSMLNYAFIDKKPLNGYSYYRLKQVDFDGNFKYSQIEEVFNDGSGTLIYPNPSDGQIYISKSDLELFDVYLTNSLCLIIEVSSYSENGLLMMVLNHLPNGIYFVLLVRNGVVESNRFVLSH